MGTVYGFIFSPIREKHVILLSLGKPERPFLQCEPLSSVKENAIYGEINKLQLDDDIAGFIEACDEMFLGNLISIHLL